MQHLPRRCTDTVTKNRYNRASNRPNVHEYRIRWQPLAHCARRPKGTQIFTLFLRDGKERGGNHLIRRCGVPGEFALSEGQATEETLEQMAAALPARSEAPDALSAGLEAAPTAEWCSNCAVARISRCFRRSSWPRPGRLGVRLDDRRYRQGAPAAAPRGSAAAGVHDRVELLGSDG